MHRILHLVTWILLIVGGLNWGVLAVFNWDISHVLGGMDSTLTQIVFVLVGLSAIYELVVHSKNCRMCNPNGAGMPGKM